MQITSKKLTNVNHKTESFRLSCIFQFLDNSAVTQIGLTEGKFEDRYYNHVASFRLREKQSSTELSKHIQKLKDLNKEYNIKWKVIANVNECKNVIVQCRLCFTEKIYIIFQPHTATLNERHNIVTSRRHAHKFMLNNA